jgi:hypothetical protein
LVECPQGFNVVGIQLEELANQALRNLSRREIHSIQGTKKSE